LINDRRIMGDYVNGRLSNLFSWVTVGVLILLTGTLVITSFLPGLLR
jgi:Mn2+/Fe2+ NRAMP family transporter